MIYSLSIIVPAYNEEENIESAARHIFAGIPTGVKEYELIIVDDGSNDRTGNIIRDLAIHDSHIKTIQHGSNTGKGAALVSGFKQAGMEWVLFTDADLQIDISELQLFLTYTSEYDVVIGHRTKRKDSIFRLFFSKCYCRLVSLLFGLYLLDINCPFKLFRRDLLARVELNSGGFFIDAELMYKINLTGAMIKEVGVDSRPRPKGKSTVRFRHVIETLRELLRLKIEK